VQRLIQIVSLILLGLWLPATMHCRLETLGFGNVFGCNEQAANQGHHGDENSCERDCCQVVESGNFVFSKAKIVPASPPVLDRNFIFCLLQVIPPPTETPIFSCAQDEPLPLQRHWQFTRRAALPARAPDAMNT
jgi:hypothetical protein